MKEEFRLFQEYLKKKELKNTLPRRKILEVFLETEKHLSADEFYRLIKKVYPKIGIATVYRTLKLIADSGLSREVELGDRLIRVEHEYGHKHHDHLICLKCGRLLEACDPQIERLQERLASKYHFKPVKHKMDIFGYCKRCQNE